MYQFFYIVSQDSFDIYLLSRSFRMIIFTNFAIHNHSLYLNSLRIIDNYDKNANHKDVAFY